MTQPDETKKPGAAELPDEALERVSGGGTVTPKNTTVSDPQAGAGATASDPHAGAGATASDPHAVAIDDKEQGFHFPHI